MSSHPIVGLRVRVEADHGRRSGGGGSHPPHVRARASLLVATPDVNRVPGRGMEGKRRERASLIFGLSRSYTKHGRQTELRMGGGGEMEPWRKSRRKVINLICSLHQHWKPLLSVTGHLVCLYPVFCSGQVITLNCPLNHVWVTLGHPVLTYTNCKYLLRC